MAADIYDTYSVHPEDEDAQCECGHERWEHGRDDSAGVGQCVHLCFRSLGQPPVDCDCECYTYDPSRDDAVLELRDQGSRWPTDWS